MFCVGISIRANTDNRFWTESSPCWFQEPRNRNEATPRSCTLGLLSRKTEFEIWNLFSIVKNQMEGQREDESGNEESRGLTGLGEGLFFFSTSMRSCVGMDR